MKQAHSSGRPTNVPNRMPFLLRSRQRFRFLAAIAALLTSTVAIGTNSSTDAASATWYTPCYKRGVVNLVNTNPHIAEAGTYTVGSTSCGRIQADLSYIFFGTWKYKSGGCVLGSSTGVWTTTAAYGSPHAGGIWGATFCGTNANLVFY